MKKNIPNKMIFIACLLMFSSFANASISLGFATPVQAGSSIDIEVIISGLGVDNAPSLAAYDLDIEFDTSHLAFSSATFGDPDIGNQLDIFDFGVNDAGAALNPAGALNIYEISLDTVNDLNDLQADVFSLATLTFNVLKTDNSELSFVINDLGDAEGNFLTADLSTITVTSVPVPAAFWLMFSGVAGVYRVRVAQKSPLPRQCHSLKKYFNFQCIA